jgi:hypothetical protein
MRSDLQFFKDGTEYMKLCVDITAYWTGQAVAHRQGILDFHDRALRVIGQHLAFYETAQMKGSVPLDKQALDLVPEWTSRPQDDQEFVSVKLEGGTVADMPSDTALGFWSVPFRGNRVGAIKAVLPAHTAANPDVLRNLAAGMIDGLALHSGHAGYSINWDYRGRYAPLCRRTMGRLARRFPGIDLPDVHAALMAVPSGLKRINWLTFLGNDLCDRFGGIAKLRDALTDPAIDLHDSRHGVMITAGGAPGIGEVNRQERLAPYHAVGRVLAPLRSHAHPPFLAGANGPIDEELSAEWLAWFDA